jgi:hypothetical protein
MTEGNRSVDLDEDEGHQARKVKIKIDRLKVKKDLRSFRLLVRNYNYGIN